MKLAIISGGSRGLGQALCELYADSGWRVVEFSRAAPHPGSVAIDLAVPERAQETFAATLRPLGLQTWDEIVVIANAGVLGPIGPTARKDPAEVLANINVNYASPILLISQTVAAFQAQPVRKTLLNISSGAAVSPYAGWSLYCAAKAGVETFVRSAALEQAAQPHPIRLINVSPGVIDTDMQAAIRAATPEDFPAVGRFIQRKADGELRSPVRVAVAVQRIAQDTSLANGARVEVTGYLDG